MGERITIILACKECAARNYKTTRVRRPSAPLEIKKFCPGCRKHTNHKETK